MPTISTFKVPHRGWVKSIREALGMTATDLGERLGIAPQSVLTLEKSEMGGRARMDSLKKVAEAMDCSFVYAFIPNSSLEGFVKKQTEYVIAETMNRVSHSMKLEGQETNFSDADYNNILNDLEGSSKIWRITPSKK